MPNIILGFTGSVASILAYELAKKLKEVGNVQTIWTEKAEFFVNKAIVRDDGVERYLSQDERDSLRRISDEAEWEWCNKKSQVLHIEIRKWADILIIAPCSAQSLAKIANGLADNLLTSVARCWDWKKPFLIAPAMNTMMWEHPVTQNHLIEVRKWGVEVVPPQVKTLACGDTGDGAMADVSKISVKAAIALEKALMAAEAKESNAG